MLKHTHLPKVLGQFPASNGWLTFNFYSSLSPRSTENACAELPWCRGVAGVSLQRVVEGDAVCPY